MLVIRLQRTGRKNIAAYRLVCTEKNAPPKGKVKEYLGHYLPTRNPHVFEFRKDRIEHWLSVGAKPSNTVARLLTHGGMTGLEKSILQYTKKRRKKQKEEKAAPEAKAAEPIAQTPEPTKKASDVDAASDKEEKKE